MAVGILNLMKLPDIPGMETVQGQVLPHRTLGLRVHRRRTCTADLDKLGDKVVAVMGTGASAIQCIPHLAESARASLCLPADAVGRRCPGKPAHARGLLRRAAVRPGWQRERMYNFHAIITGRPVEVDLVDDGWTNHMARVWNPRMGPDMSIEEIMYQAEADDFEIMEDPSPTHRRDGERSREGGDPQALLPLPLQAPVLPRRVPARLQPAKRHPGRLPLGDRAGDGDGTHLRRQGVRGRLPGLRHRVRSGAHALSRGAPATRSSDVAASDWRTNGRSAPPPCTASCREGSRTCSSCRLPVSRP